MKYKLIAVDLDGTLYNDQLKITSDTLNTMIKAQEMGIRIALASGRPLPGLFHARDLLQKSIGKSWSIWYSKRGKRSDHQRDDQR